MQAPPGRRIRPTQRATRLPVLAIGALSGARKPAREAIWFSLHAVTEIVEQHYAIGLRPHTHFSGIRKALISCIDYFVAIERDGELVAFKIHAQRVPHAGCYLGVDVFERHALAVDRVIN